MCYLNVNIKEPEIFVQFPEITDDFDFEIPDEEYFALLFESRLHLLVLFRDFIEEKISCLTRTKSSRDEMSISKLFVNKLCKKLNVSRNVIKDSVVEEEIKMIYERVFFTEQQYDDIIGGYIELFEYILQSMTEKINEFEASVGDLDQMNALFDEFNEFSETVVSNEGNSVCETLSIENIHYHKTQLSYIQHLNDILSKH